MHNSKDKTFVARSPHKYSRKNFCSCLKIFLFSPLHSKLNEETFAVQGKTVQGKTVNIWSLECFVT